MIYFFSSTMVSSSSLNFVINRPPQNGTCSIEPQNGTTSTPFTVSCPHWTDEDEIKDFSLLTWAEDPAERTLIAFSSIPIFEVYLPATVGSISLLISIRDRRDCVTEWTNLSSTSVQSDFNLEDSFDDFITNPFVRLLINGNQNLIGQVISSLFHYLNQLNTKNVHQAMSSESILLSSIVRNAYRFSLSVSLDGIPATSISVSSLGSVRSTVDVGSTNLSVLKEFEWKLHLQASFREYLIGFLTRLPITTLNTIKLQAKSFALLTESTNQLSRLVLVKDFFVLAR